MLQELRKEQKITPASRIERQRQEKTTDSGRNKTRSGHGILFEAVMNCLVCGEKTKTGRAGRPGRYCDDECKEIAKDEGRMKEISRLKQSPHRWDEVRHL